MGGWLDIVTQSPDGGRCPPQLAVAEPDHEQAQPKQWHRGTDQGNDSGHVINEASVFDSAQDAEGDARNHADEKRSDTQFDGRGKPCREILCNRMSGVPPVAKITAKYPRGVVHKLLPQRFVKSHVFAKFREDAGRGLFPGESPGRITGKNSSDEEDANHNPRERGNHGKHPLEHEGHTTSLPALKVRQQSDGSQRYGDKVEKAAPICNAISLFATNVRGCGVVIASVVCSSANTTV